MTDVFDKLSEVETTKIAVDTLTCCFEARTKRTVSGLRRDFRCQVVARFLKTRIVLKERERNPPDMCIGLLNLLMFTKVLHFSRPTKPNTWWTY